MIIPNVSPILIIVDDGVTFSLPVPLNFNNIINSTHIKYLYPNREIMGIPSIADSVLIINNFF